MVMTKDYFVDNSKLEEILDDGEYDYIVIGSGCTALAFIQQELGKDSDARILCFERGEFWLPAHFENLPLPFKTSAWSPQPHLEDMEDFPKAMIDTARQPKFWEDAKELLHVTGADKIGDSVYSGLQREIDQRLKDRWRHITTTEYSEPAQLAVGRGSVTLNLRFNKFSTPAPLLKIYEEQKSKNAASLDILLNCTVKTLGAVDDDEDGKGHVHSIETTRRTIAWQGDNTKVILCASASPAATILLNSFPECRKTGLEYWHIDEHEPNKGSWKPAHPKQSEIRIPGIVHETSTAFMGSNPSDGSSVGPKYNVHGVPNVYVTGGALFPTAGSWNPTLTMCGFAQDLARQLEKGRH
ncbi:hypothetical protein CGLO_03361 [Colletotrichum gloeosporioides Cg-14]|uniref:Glucose-methanol-choline oxidoreductase C-terminal domain-containing protein n=1 Tax=Colletotrichum gloeosporioides (strain Cg-14) TaxID=1237896 RepID=T0KLW0_COLGC|nr:hypothetical protein CGLO_03361 [Colletotrichum gloeosporioides Cg-14]